MASTVLLLKTRLKSGEAHWPENLLHAVADPRPLDPDTWHSSSLLPSPAPTHSSFPKTWARDQDSVPRKGYRIPRDSSFARSQPGNLCCPIPIQLFCPACPPSSPEARSGEGRPWLLHFLLHCLPDNGQSSTKSDHGLTTPQTQIRAKRVRGGCGEGSCQQGQMTRETLHGLRRVREEGNKAKMSWVQTVSTTSCYTLAPTLRESKGSSYGTLVNQRLFHA